MNTVFNRRSDPAEELRRRTKRANLKRKLKDNVALWGLALPGFFLLLLFRYVPMGGIVIAFKNYVPRKGIFGSDWNGFKNFEFFFTSQEATIVLRNTILINLATIILGLVVSVAIALLMNEIASRVKTRLYQTILFFPYFLSWVVVGYMFYAFLSPQYGMFNQLIIDLGGEKIQW